MLNLSTLFIYKIIHILSGIVIIAYTSKASSIILIMLIITWHLGNYHNLPWLIDFLTCIQLNEINYLIWLKTWWHNLVVVIMTIFEIQVSALNRQCPTIKTFKYSQDKLLSMPIEDKVLFMFINEYGKFPSKLTIILCILHEVYMFDHCNDCSIYGRYLFSWYKYLLYRKRQRKIHFI